MIVCLLLCIAWSAAWAGQSQPGADTTNAHSPLGAGSLSAPRPLVIGDSAHYPLKQHLHFANVGTATVGVASMIRDFERFSYGQSTQWQWQSGELTGSPFRTPEAYWFITPIKQKTHSHRELLVHFGDVLMTNVDIYLTRGNRVIKHFQSNQQHELEDPFDRRWHTARIELPDTEEYYLVIRAVGSAELVYGYLSIWDTKAFIMDNHTLNMVYWFHYGVMAFIFCCSLVAYFYMRSKAFLYYALFVASSTTVFFSLIWPGSMVVTGRTALAVILAAVSTRLLFLDELLDLKHEMPAIHKVMLGYIYLALGVIAINLFLPAAQAYNATFGMLMLSTPVQFLLFLASFWLWRRGNSEAGIYMVVFVVYILFNALPPVFIFVFDLDPTNPRLFSRFADSFLAIGLLAILLRRLANIRLQERLAKAESQAKSEFVARMSHELRTPMTGVLGLVDLLEGTQQDKTQSRYTEMIRKCGNALMAIINDILDTSKIAAGKMEIRSQPVRLSELVLDCVDIFAIKAREKRIEFIASVDSDLPEWVLGDSARLRQVLINLLGNAFKFTDRGDVRLRIHRDSRHPKMLAYTVSDTGIGISESDQEKLFDPFIQVDASTSRQYGGTGLGLNICKELAELMGGRIEMHSELNRGSSFTVSLPLKPADIGDEHSDEYRDDVIAGRNIVFFSASQVYRQAAQQFLSAAGATVRVCDDPARLPQLLAADTPDVLCLDTYSDDAVLTFLNDWEASHPDAELKTVALGLQHREANRKEYLGEHIAWAERPIFINSLLDIVLVALGLVRHPRYDRHSRRDPAKAVRILNVLMAEDNPVNRTVLQGMLERLGHRPNFADNGLETVQRYKQSLLKQDQRRFDLILMDCEMPQMDGYQASRTIRDWEAETGLPPVPIVALSANTADEHLRRCDESGMDDVLCKPIKLEELKVKLDEYALLLDEQFRSA